MNGPSPLKPKGGLIGPTSPVLSRFLKSKISECYRDLSSIETIAYRSAARSDNFLFADQPAGTLSMGAKPLYTGFQILAESLLCTIQQGQGGNGLRSQPRHRPAEEILPSDGQCNAAPCYSLNATPLNAATPGALDVATWVKSP